MERRADTTLRVLVAHGIRGEWGSVSQGLEESLRDFGTLLTDQLN